MEIFSVRYREKRKEIVSSGLSVCVSDDWVFVSNVFHGTNGVLVNPPFFPTECSIYYLPIMMCVYVCVCMCISDQICDEFPSIKAAEAPLIALNKFLQTIAH